MSYNSKRTGQEVENLLDKIDDKVDKVEGKQLSTEDFTTALMNKLNSLNNYDDTEINEVINALREDFNTLVSGDTTTAIKSFNDIIAFLNGIEDSESLDSIIASIQQQIAGKMDEVTLATVATSGSYNDLTDKPTIPAVVTESTISGWGFTKNAGTYSKPSGGIPKTDLTSDVQTSLGKADTALQSYTEQYKGTVTGVKVNGSTKSPSSGTVDLGNVVTSIKINGSTKTPSNGVVDLGTIKEENSSSGGSEYFNPITLNPSTTAIELVNSGVYILDCIPYANYTITINGQGNFTLLISCNYVYGSISISHKSGKIVWTSEKSPIFTTRQVTELSLCSLPTSTSVGYIVLGTWASYNAQFSNPSGGGGAD